MGRNFLAALLLLAAILVSQSGFALTNELDATILASDNNLAQKQSEHETPFSIKKEDLAPSDRSYRDYRNAYTTPPPHANGFSNLKSFLLPIFLAYINLIAYFVYSRAMSGSKISADRFLIFSAAVTYLLIVTCAATASLYQDPLNQDPYDPINETTLILKRQLVAWPLLCGAIYGYYFFFNRRKGIK